MKLLLPILWRRGLIVIVVTLSVGILHTQAQSDSTDNELVFHVVKKRICEKEKPQTDLMREGLKGRVEAVQMNFFTDDRGDEVFRPRPKASMTKGYRDDGIVESPIDTVAPRRDSRKRKENSPYYMKSDRYDTSGTLIMSVTRNKSQYNYRINRVFQSHRIEAETHQSSYGYNKKMAYQYDVKGRLTAIRVQGYYRKGRSKHVPFAYVCRYNNAGQCIESSMDNDQGRSLFTYDENGFCIQRVDKPQYSLPTTTTYIYGGNCKVKEATRLGNSNGKTIYEYDEKDSLIIQRDQDMRQAQAAKDGPMVSDTAYISYKYDDKGNRTEEKMLDKYGHSYEKKYQYVYDERGNWTQKTEYTDKQKTGYYIRKITYY